MVSSFLYKDINLPTLVNVKTFPFQNGCVTKIKATKEWIDNKLMWSPEEYGGVKKLYVPAEMIWLPDIVLYNKYGAIANFTSEPPFSKMAAKMA
ncbi:Acetylcholine receptor subunit beta-like 2 [Nymphon striatum]|nr:Acetylcholine receptor subunit beta-like 2 [Nymphon striatum]